MKPKKFVVILIVVASLSASILLAFTHTSNHADNQLAQMLADRLVLRGLGDRVGLGFKQRLKDQLTTAGVKFTAASKI